MDPIDCAEMFPHLEEINYFLHQNYCRKPTNKIFLSSKPLVINNTSKKCIEPLIRIFFMGGGVLNDFHMLQSINVGLIKRMEIRLDTFEMTVSKKL